MKCQVPLSRKHNMLNNQILGSGILCFFAFLSGFFSHNLLTPLSSESKNKVLVSATDDAGPTLQKLTELLSASLVELSATRRLLDGSTAVIAELSSTKKELNLRTAEIKQVTASLSSTFTDLSSTRKLIDDLSAVLAAATTAIKDDYRIATNSQSPQLMSWRYLNAHDFASAGDGVITFALPSWVFLKDFIELPSPPSLQHVDSTENVDLFDSIFFGLRGGTIFESGALDGITLSNTIYPVKHLGWRAIHVEASPPNFASLVKNRPESLNIFTALCNATRSVHFVFDERHGPNGAIFEFSEPQHQDWWRKNFGGGTVGEEKIKQLPLIPCRPSAPLLSLIGISHIDLWVLDVEFGEEQVLSAFDFEAVSVDVILMEMLPWTDGSGRETLLKEKLVNYGYTFHGKRGHDGLFFRNSFTPCSKISCEKGSRKEGSH